MTKTQRPIAFVLAATNHGTMLVNRNDQKINPQGGGIGVGFEILRNSSCTQDEVDLALHLLTLRRRHFGDGVFAIDCGANIGTHTVEWARLMHGWGQVLAFEAQERIYYALAGNVTLNNCFNARVVFAAVGQTTGQILVPQPNYLAPGSYGSLEFRSSASTEDIGQPIDYRAEAALSVPLIAMDDLILSRLDLMKLDIEGMEIEALCGADRLIRKHLPIILVEVIKSDQVAIRDFLQARGYAVFVTGINFLAVHTTDPSLEMINDPIQGQETANR